MIHIATHNHKGGCGKTTLAAHIVHLALEKGLHVLAVDLDRQGNLIKWLSGGDQVIEDGALCRLGSNGTVIFSPDVFPEGQFKKLDLIVTDTPPSASVPKHLRPDVWLTPIDGRMALEGAANVTRDVLMQGEGRAPVRFVLNGCEEGGLLSARDLRHALADFIQSTRGLVDVYPEDIPRSAAIKRAGERFMPVWKVPYGEHTAGALAMRGLAEWVVAGRWQADTNKPPEQESRKARRRA